ncbi:MAG TPA: YdcF family protein [Trichocoleus sp.]|jgi:uncharacterized SAM-binding protein YcdF (DUF218 family)
MLRGQQYLLHHLLHRSRFSFFRRIRIGIGLFLAMWLLLMGLQLRSAARQPVEAFLVLGGSIRREIYVASLVQQFPEVPVLISSGSPPPCLWLIFQRAGASMHRVWLENCARSTFGNFFYSTPILQQWHVHKVKLITSPTHLPRALWLGRILLAAHGIWVEPEIVTEQGIPGNRESWLKTGLDMARGLLWAGISQIYQPTCQNLQLLEAIDRAEWNRQGFTCERQGNLEK